MTDKPREGDTRKLVIDTGDTGLGEAITKAMCPTEVSAEPEDFVKVRLATYGNLLAIWQTALMLFGGLPDEMPDIEAMRRRMHQSAQPREEYVPFAQPESAAKVEAIAQEVEHLKIKIRERELGWREHLRKQEAANKNRLADYSLRLQIERERAEIAEKELERLRPYIPSQPEQCNAEIADSRAVRFLSEYPPEKFSSSREMLRNFAFWLGYFAAPVTPVSGNGPEPEGTK